MLIVAVMWLFKNQPSPYQNSLLDEDTELLFHSFIWSLVQPTEGFRSPLNSQMQPILLFSDLISSPYLRTEPRGYQLSTSSVHLLSDRYLFIFKINAMYVYCV